MSGGLHLQNAPSPLSGQLGRRQFLAHASGAVAAFTATSSVRLFAADASPAAIAPAAAVAPQPENLVKLLFESFTPRQRELVCFNWDHVDPSRGLLRSRVANNWQITNQVVNTDFYTADQKHIIRAIVDGLIVPEWHERFDQQQNDDAGGFGEDSAIALFGTPGQGKSEFVITGRHLTLRCDGNTGEHVAFGGPIFYGHDASGVFNEDADHPGNVFWPQAQVANNLYQALDGKQQQLALVRNAPSEEAVGFKGKHGKFDGIPVTELSADQRQRVQGVLQKLIEPYRSSDKDEVVACLKAQGGLDACHLAFYQSGDIGADKVWDVWRLEGPAFVWHFRGSPHVHVWVNVADDPSVKLNV
jgi:hypothetical protein